MDRTRQTSIRRVAVWPVVRLGAISGGVVALPAGVVCGVLLRLFAGAVRRTLEDWAAVRLPSPVPAVSGPTANFVALLHLQTALSIAQAWDAPWVPVVVPLAVMASGALVGSLAALLAVVLLNAGASTGRGLEVYVEDDPPDQAAR